MTDVDTLDYARLLDKNDILSQFRNEFVFPKGCSIYLCGNSLGLLSKKSKEYVVGALEKWGEEGVEGHFTQSGLGPWVTIDENCIGAMAEIVGAKVSEVTLMNSLTVNLHLLMISFYRPNEKRHKILIEAKAFPSDYIAVRSQILEKGFNPDTSLIVVKPRHGEELIHTEDIVSTIEEHKDSLALVMLSGIQYYTGQAFEMKKIVSETRRITGNQCNIGFDLAHAVGNIEMSLHDWDVDFAAWCTYKYLNSGPGGIGGAFVHEKHHQTENIPRLCGWWGHRKSDRFKMNDSFIPTEGAFGWQLSNPAVLTLVSLQGSLEIFAQAKMTNLRKKSEQLTHYLEQLLKSKLPQGECTIITPGYERSNERGCQLSLVFAKPVKDVHSYLESKGIICDMREPNVMRIAPAPLYNSYEDVYNFVEHLSSYFSHTSFN